MKTIIKTLGAFILFTGFAFRTASPENAGLSGLYLTKDDFLQHHLSYSFDCRDGKDKIRLHELFGSSKLEVVYQGKKYAFSKKDVYGYRDCKDHDYRFSGPGGYRILDTAGFYLYSYSKLVKGEKISRPQTLTYFSMNADAPIQELTLANLERAFAGDVAFRYRLEAQFRSDKELIAYDGMLKMYKIKYVYGLRGQDQVNDDQTKKIEQTQAVKNRTITKQ